MQSVFEHLINALQMSGHGYDLFGDDKDEIINVLHRCEAAENYIRVSRNPSNSDFAKDFAYGTWEMLINKPPEK